MLSHCTEHISAHFSPALKQQQSSFKQGFLQEHDKNSKISSGAGFELSHFTVISPSATPSHVHQAKVLLKVEI